MSLKDTITFIEEAAQAEADATHDALTTAESTFDAERDIARRLGGRVDGDVCIFGFWTPELLDARVPTGDIFLEILRPVEPVDLTRSHQQVSFERAYVPMVRMDAYCFTAVSGLRPGNIEVVGDFYALVWRDAEGTWHRILDPLAACRCRSARFAPAELYDVGVMQARVATRPTSRRCAALGAAQGRTADEYPADPRSDRHGRRDARQRSRATIERLANRVAQRLCLLRRPIQLFLGYDAVQLLPVEPTTVYEAGHDFWQRKRQDERRRVGVASASGHDELGLRRRHLGHGAVNPVLLETGRPDELVELAAVLHTFPVRSRRC
jgi:hypothetical protein